MGIPICTVSIRIKMKSKAHCITDKVCSMVTEMQYEQALLGIDLTLAAVKRQRIKQLEKWGTQEHSPGQDVAGDTR